MLGIIGVLIMIIWEHIYATLESKIVLKAQRRLDVKKIKSLNTEFMHEATD